MINNVKTAIIKLFTPRDPWQVRREMIDEYLAKSVDRIDLEKREQELERKGFFY